MSKRKRIAGIKVGSTEVKVPLPEHDDVMTIEEFTEWVKRVTEKESNNLNK